ncbi:MAG: FG-GAP-like repeat-containing protein, partial [Myxococcales bacterium]
STEIEDGQPVALTVTSTATPPAAPVTVRANAMSGVANFAGVTLNPDGQYKMSATCTSKANTIGHSMNATFTVDTTPPTLTIDRPLDGASFAPGQLVNGAFQVCATTTSADAADLAATATIDANNLCVTRGQSTDCVPVLAASTSTCVDVACPGGAPFDLTVTLRDAAGNPQTSTISGISCASSAPSVQIVTPSTDAPSFSDVSKRLLAASSTQTLKDSSSATAGAQTTVVACTNTMGASARLMVGQRGDATLTALGSPVTVVAAVAADNCPAALGFVAKFVDVTLPESAEAADGSLMTATEIRVDVTDPVNVAAVGTSGPTDLWVDSTVPTLTEKTPTPFCGSTQAANATFTTTVTLNSSTPVVTLSVTNGMTVAYGPPTYVAGTPAGEATFTAVDFPQGSNLVSAQATEPAGNTASLTPPVPMMTCTVTVGSAPVLTFTAPGAGQNLCANGNAAAACVADSTAGTPGWQGAIVVHVATPMGVAITTGNVALSIGGGTPVSVAVDASGNATFSGVSIPDGSAVTLTAVNDSVPPGMASRTVVVDTLAPAAVSLLTAQVLDRRQTSFRPTWIAPDDNGQAVTGYEVRVAKVQVTDANFDTATVTQAIPFTGSPAAPGMPNGVVARNLNIEQDYYFGVKAKDAAGNLGPLVATTVASTARFVATVLSGAGTDGFGYTVDGAGDFGRLAGLGFVPDGYSDLVVGATGGKHVYLYFGSATGYNATPSVTITLQAATGIVNAIDAGDLDGDGLDDLAISSSSESKVYIYSRKNPPVSWGTSTGWPATLNDTQANYVINVGGMFMGVLSTRPLGRLGNFDGMGADDLSIGTSSFSTQTGAVFIVKGSTTFGSLSLPDPVNSIEIDGTAMNTLFGSIVMGIGRFYPPPPASPTALGNTIVVSAPKVGTTYAFPGQSPAGVVTAAVAVDSVVDATTSLVLGFLGPLGVSPGAISIGAPVGKYVDVHLGTPVTGPLLGVLGGAPASSVRFVDSMVGNAFGVINVGGGILGTSANVSFIGGDNVSDLVLAGQRETGDPVYIVSGAAIPTLSGSVDVSVPQTAVVPSVVKIINQIPQTPLVWGGFSMGSVVPDCDGDQYGDFVVGEVAFGKAGRAVVFH